MYVYGGETQKKTSPGTSLRTLADEDSGSGIERDGDPARWIGEHGRGIPSSGAYAEDETSPGEGVVREESNVEWEG